MTQTGRPDHTGCSTLAACVAHIAGASASEVPLDRRPRPLNDGGVLRLLMHRGGLRADIVQGGTIRVGDRLIPD
jgi:hypothetical protein